MIPYIVVVLVLIIALGLLTHDVISHNKSKMYDHYKTLILLLQKNDEEIKIQSSKFYMKLTLTRIGGTTFFYLFQAFGVLAVEWEDDSKYKRNRIEWYYSAKVKQEDIYHHITNDILDFYSRESSNKSIQYAQPDATYHVQKIRQKILLSNTTDIETGDLFNLAWAYTAYLDEYRTLSPKGKFEVLAYNCISILCRDEGIRKKERVELEDNFIELLIFYLTKNSLIESIHNLADFINYRIKIYSSCYDELQVMSTQTSNLLFELFYVFPLNNNALMNSYSNVPKDFIVHVSTMSNQLAEDLNIYMCVRKKS